MVRARLGRECRTLVCGRGVWAGVHALGRSWDGARAGQISIACLRHACCRRGRQRRARACVALPAPGVILVAVGSPACPTCRHDGRRALSARLQRAAQFTTAHVVAEEARRQHATRITWPGRPPSTDSLQPRQGGCITVGRRRERIVSVHRPDPVCAATQSSCSAFLPHGLFVTCAARYSRPAAGRNWS